MPSLISLLFNINYRGCWPIDLCVLLVLYYKVPTKILIKYNLAGLEL